MRTTEKRQEVAQLWAFVNDVCVVDDSAVSRPAELYEAYVAWARSRGIVLLPKYRFGVRLTDMGFRRSMALGGVGVRLGLRLRAREAAS